MGNSLIIPFFGMMFLTATVWTYMYARRLYYVLSNHIPAQELSTPEKLDQRLPDRINAPSNNLKNLFELPVVFYAGCLYQLIQGDPTRLVLCSAYCFLGFRVCHSLVHCTFNWVILRFLTYVLAAIALFVMIIAEFISTTALG